MSFMNSAFYLWSASGQEEVSGALRLPATFDNRCYRQEEVEDSLRLLTTH